MIDGLRLPSHWKWATFADVAYVASDLVDPTFMPEAIHIAPNHIESWTGKLLPFATVAEDGVTSPKHRFHAGQILYSKIRPYLAKAVFATFEGVCSADMYPVESSVDPKFLLHWILSTWFTGQTARNQGRTILPKINRDALGRLPVPVAPLSEQQRIATKIDELFSYLDAGVAALERIKANLKRYRAAVLKAAVEGRVTEAWRAKHPKTEPASKLLERILAERRQNWEKDQLAKFAAAGKTPLKGWREKYVEPAAPETRGLPELPQGWCWASMEQLVTRSEYGTSVKCDYGASGPPVLRIPNIAKGKIDLGDMKQATVQYQLAQQDALQNGDLLMCRTNGSISLIGKAALMQATYEPLHTFASYLLRFRFGERDTLPKWVHVFVTSHYGRLFIEKNAASSAGQHNISLSLIHSMPLPLPPLGEQAEITQDVERRLSIIEGAKAQADANVIRATRLRQCILKRAFEGKLVPQYPQDELASVLLERLRSSLSSHKWDGREATPARTRGRRTKSKQVVELSKKQPK